MLRSLLVLALALTGTGGKIFVNVVKDGDKTELGGMWCHEELMRNYTDQVLKLQRDHVIANQRLIELGASLREVKELLASGSSSSPATRHEDMPSSCAEALKSGKPNGVYRIHVPGSSLEPFGVYCLRDAQQAGDAWTVIQRRQDGSIDFYRRWTAYKNGFGNLAGEFFVGLDRLHAMTNYVEHELWVQMEDWKGEKRYARYPSFAIGDERAKYALNVLGIYDGDAGDSLREHRGLNWSTQDSDNDNDNGNCAIAFAGAWWYNKCHVSNLNGKYLQGEKLDYKGIQWQSWHGDYSLKYVHMAIRPAQPEL